jgi:gamma-glutamyltranspeptidase
MILTWGTFFIYSPSFFDQELVAALEDIGHEITTVTGFASVVSIGRMPEGWNPVCDPRKHGQCGGF